VQANSETYQLTTFHIATVAPTIETPALTADDLRNAALPWDGMEAYLNSNSNNIDGDFSGRNIGGKPNLRARRYGRQKTPPELLYQASLDKPVPPHVPSANLLDKDNTVVQDVWMPVVDIAVS
jgi:hypothetical protein